jgi:predicted transcriptional regulator
MKGEKAAEIEDVLCSRARIKILKLLIQSDQLNTSEIAHQIRSNHTSTSTHLKALEDDGIFTHRMYGKRIRLYTFNEASAMAKALQKLITAYTEDKLQSIN